jgi:hypothetical protein
MTLVKTWFEQNHNMLSAEEATLTPRQMALSEEACNLIHEIVAGQFDGMYASLRHAIRALGQGTISLISLDSESSANASDVLVRLAQVFPWFTEVASTHRIAPSSLEDRLYFARSTGFLPMLPDEAIGVVRNRGSGESGQVFECMPNGQPRVIAGIYIDAYDHYGKPRSIASLTKSQAQDASGKARGDIQWWCPQTLRTDQVTRDRMMLTLKLVSKRLEHAPLDVKPSGATIERLYPAHTDGYHAISKLITGFRHYPTEEDAWYFKIAFCPVRREIISYCEGDVHRVRASNDEQFLAELAELARIYGARRRPSMIGYSSTENIAYFDTLFFGGTIPKEKALDVLLLTPGLPVRSDEGWQAPWVIRLHLDGLGLSDLMVGDGRVFMASKLIEGDLLDERSFQIDAWHFTVTRETEKSIRVDASCNDVAMIGRAILEDPAG